MVLKSKQPLSYWQEWYDSGKQTNGVYSCDIILTLELHNNSDNASMFEMDTVIAKHSLADADCN